MYDLQPCCYLLTQCSCSQSVAPIQKMAYGWVLSCRSYLHDDCLLGLSQLKHLDTLELPSNSIKSAACLTPLPVNLRVLNLSNNPGVISLSYVRLDITAALTQLSQGLQAHERDNDLPAQAGVVTSSTPAASLESLDISGLMLSQPSVLGGLTNLTTLHAGGLHSPEPKAILAMVHHMPKLSPWTSRCAATQPMGWVSLRVLDIS